MNTKEYIASGILEAYVIGETTDQERKEVECLSKIYPEVKEELTRLELTMEAYAQAHAIPANRNLKEKIFAEINFEESENPEVLEQKIINLWPKVSIAAAVLLGVLALGLFYQNNTMKQQMAMVKNENQKMADEMSKDQKLISLFKETKMVKLKGVEKSPESLAMVFYDEKNASASIMVESLPKAPTGMQYQLWGIVDGVPVDMGMIDNQSESKVLAMKNIKGKPAAFAITLEKQGGSPTPTLEEMYVIGNV